MHGHRCIQSLLGDLTDRAHREKTTRITVVSLRLGPSEELTEQAVRDLFEIHAKGTVAEGAELAFSPGGPGELALLSFDCE